MPSLGPHARAATVGPQRATLSGGALPFGCLLSHCTRLSASTTALPGNGAFSCPHPVQCRPRPFRRWTTEREASPRFKPWRSLGKPAPPPHNVSLKPGAGDTEASQALTPTRDARPRERRASTGEAPGLPPSARVRSRITRGLASPAPDSFTLGGTPAGDRGLSVFSPLCPHLHT